MCGKGSPITLDEIKGFNWWTSKGGFTVGGGEIVFIVLTLHEYFLCVMVSDVRERHLCPAGVVV